MKNLAYRLGFALPLAVFGVFVLLILLGIGTDLLGIGPLFYCNVFCKIGVSLFAVAITGTVLYCFNCWAHENAHKPPHLPA